MGALSVLLPCLLSASQQLSLDTIHTISSKILRFVPLLVDLHQLILTLLKCPILLIHTARAALVSLCHEAPRVCTQLVTHVWRAFTGAQNEALRTACVLRLGRGDSAHCQLCCQLHLYPFWKNKQTHHIQVLFCEVIHTQLPWLGQTHIVSVIMWVWVQSEPCNLDTLLCVWQPFIRPAGKGWHVHSDFLNLHIWMCCSANFKLITQQYNYFSPIISTNWYCPKSSLPFVRAPVPGLK